MVKGTNAPNFHRSAVEPRISAGVMMANISWNAENTSGGMDCASGPTYPGTDSAPPPTMWARPAKWKSPMRLLPLPKARLYVKQTHSKLMMPMQKKFCMIMPRTFLLRTSPP